MEVINIPCFKTFLAHLLSFGNRTFLHSSQFLLLSGRLLHLTLTTQPGHRLWLRVVVGLISFVTDVMKKLTQAPSLPKTSGTASFTLDFVCSIELEALSSCLHVT